MNPSTPTRPEPGDRISSGTLVRSDGEAFPLRHLGREPTHDFPLTEEVEEWLKYLATQCPECGVPDVA